MHHWTLNDLVPQDDECQAFDTLLQCENAGRVLISAFELNLSRFETWNLDFIPASLHPAFIAAAAVYKRGVSVSGQNNGWPRLKTKPHSPRTASIVDQNVFKYWWPELPSPDLILESREAQKSVHLANQISTYLHQNKISHLQVYSGGLLADVCGFVAGIHGITYELIPTTLLAMVDSSYGGKTAINTSRFGKNQIGLFYPPTVTKFQSKFLLSLSEEHLISGLCESLKHALISQDLKLWRKLLHIADSKSWNELHSLIEPIAHTKNLIVERDPLEQGERQTLNFGHTIGHAVEQIATNHNIDLPHGSAVAFGMAYEAILHAKTFQEDSWINVARDLVSSKLWPDLSSLRQIIPVELSSFVSLDKKNQTVAPRFTALLGFESRRPASNQYSFEVKDWLFPALLEDLIKFNVIRNPASYRLD